eukprot:scaffold67146_cov30-Tisochrysis_lutea.AAC.7
MMRTQIPQAKYNNLDVGPASRGAEDGRGCKRLHGALKRQQLEDDEHFARGRLLVYTALITSGERAPGWRRQPITARSAAIVHNSIGKSQTEHAQGASRMHAFASQCEHGIGCSSRFKGIQAKSEGFIPRGSRRVVDSGGSGV